MFDVIKKWTPANKRFVTIGLTLTIGIQTLVLTTEYLSSVWPLWFGTPVILNTVPIDPRSLFRGNYVKLNYDISNIKADLTPDHFKSGEVGYVTLQEKDGVYIASGLYKEKPESGVFIRGRVLRVNGSYRLDYGIEAYFMPKKKALEAEKKLREGAKAKIYLLDSGKAAIAKLDFEL